MKKEWKDYAHLYLGCEVKEDSHLIPVFILKGIDINGRCELMNKNGMTHFAGVNIIKPILRPLSDLKSWNEIKEVRQIMLEYENLSFDKTIQPYTMQGGDFFYDNIDDWGNHISSVSSNKDNLPLKVVPYLLSKHFDLFGLIESGLAIDKTTLKEKV